MKTAYELKFEKLIISSICEADHVTPHTRSELFHEFYKCGPSYYEELCDALFLLSTGECEGSLFMTPAGRPYISLGGWKKEDRWLFCGTDLPVFKGDLYDQLNYFIHSVSNRKIIHNMDKSAIDKRMTM